MGNHQLRHLIKMANQIANNNQHAGDEDAVSEIVATHLQKFWARSMKAQIIDYNQTSGGDNLLTPTAQTAVNKLVPPST